MTKLTIECVRTVVAALLAEMQSRLDASGSTINSAEALAELGDVERATRMLLDAEEPLFKAARMLEAIVVVNRLPKLGTEH